MIWSYGVTTVPARFHTTLPDTLRSLADAGFLSPHLFVDGAGSVTMVPSGVRRVTTRSEPVGVAGNWVLSLYELYYVQPKADFYAVFQDDLEACRNLKTYLERCRKPKCKHYLSLYTSRSNQKSVPTCQGTPVDGWYTANQLGRGAVGLVFDRDAVVALLSSPHLAARPQDPVRGNVAIDGGIVTALTQVGYKEYVHHPSLLQHTGVESTLGNQFVRTSDTFRGANYDPMELLEKARA